MQKSRRSGHQRPARRPAVAAVVPARRGRDTRDRPRRARQAQDLARRSRPALPGPRGQPAALRVLRGGLAHRGSRLAGRRPAARRAVRQQHLAPGGRRYTQRRRPHPGDRLSGAPAAGSRRRRDARDQRPQHAPQGADARHHGPASRPRRGGRLDPALHRAAVPALQDPARHPRARSRRIRGDPDRLPLLARGSAQRSFHRSSSRFSRWTSREPWTH